MLAVYQVRRYCCGCRSLVCAFFVVCAEEAGSKTKTKKSKKRKIKKQSTIDYYCYRDRSVKNNFPAGNNYRLRRVWPGIWIAYTILPPPPQGPKKKTSQFFFFLDYLCDDRTAEAFRHIMANIVRNITSHLSYDILYLVFFWFAERSTLTSRHPSYDRLYLVSLGLYFFFQLLILFSAYYSRDNCTEEACRHIKANIVRNITSPVFFCFAACLYTLHGRVLNGHTILTCTRISA